MGRPENVSGITPIMLLCCFLFLENHIHASRIPMGHLPFAEESNHVTSSWDSENADVAPEELTNLMTEDALTQKSKLAPHSQRENNGEREEPNFYNSLKSYTPHPMTAMLASGEDGWEDALTPLPSTYSSPQVGSPPLVHFMKDKSLSAKPAAVKDTTAPDAISSADSNTVQKWTLTPLHHLIIKQSRLSKTREWKARAEKQGQAARENMEKHDDDALRLLQRALSFQLWSRSNNRRDYTSTVGHDDGSDDVSRNGAKGHHEKVRGLFTSNSIKTGNMPAPFTTSTTTSHTKETTIAPDTSLPQILIRGEEGQFDDKNYVKKMGTTGTEELGGNGESGRLSSLPFKFPYRIPFAYVRRGHNEDGYETETGAKAQNTNDMTDPTQRLENQDGVLLQRRNRSRRNAPESEVDQESTGARGVEGAETETTAHNSGHQHNSAATTANHSQAEVATNVKNTVPLSNPLEALERLTRLLEKMVRELSQFRQKFTLRMIRMTERQDLDQIQNIMKDFDISPEKPIFFIAGGLRKPNISVTSAAGITLKTSSELEAHTTTSSAPILPVSSDETRPQQEPSGLIEHVSKITTVEPLVGIIPQTTSLPVEPQILKDETNPEPQLSRQNNSNTEQEIPTASNTTTERILSRHTRSRSNDPHDLNIMFDYLFPIPGRSARTENPYDDDEEYERLSYETEGVENSHGRWFDQDFERSSTGVDSITAANNPDKYNFPPSRSPIDQSHEHRHDYVRSSAANSTNNGATTISISSPPPELKAYVSSSSPPILQNATDSISSADGSITLQKPSERSNDQDEAEAQASGVNGINLAYPSPSPREQQTELTFARENHSPLRTNQDEGASVDDDDDDDDNGEDDDDDDDDDDGDDDDHLRNTTKGAIPHERENLHLASLSSTEKENKVSSQEAPVTLSKPEMSIMPLKEEKVLLKNAGGSQELLSEQETSKSGTLTAVEVKPSYISGVNKEVASHNAISLTDVAPVEKETRDEQSILPLSSPPVVDEHGIMSSSLDNKVPSVDVEITRLPSPPPSVSSSHIDNVNITQVFPARPDDAVLKVDVVTAPANVRDHNENLEVKGKIGTPHSLDAIIEQAGNNSETVNNKIQIDIGIKEEHPTQTSDTTLTSENGRSDNKLSKQLPPSNDLGAFEDIEKSPFFRSTPTQDPLLYSNNAPVLGKVEVLSDTLANNVEKDPKASVVVLEGTEMESGESRKTFPLSTNQENHVSAESVGGNMKKVGSTVEKEVRNEEEKQALLHKEPTFPLSTVLEQSQIIRNNVSSLPDKKSSNVSFIQNPGIDTEYQSILKENANNSRNTVSSESTTTSALQTPSHFVDQHQPTNLDAIRASVVPDGKLEERVPIPTVTSISAVVEKGDAHVAGEETAHIKGESLDPEIGLRETQTTKVLSKPQPEQLSDKAVSLPTGESIREPNDGHIEAASLGIEPNKGANTFVVADSSVITPAATEILAEKQSAILPSEKRVVETVSIEVAPENPSAVSEAVDEKEMIVDNVPSSGTAVNEIRINSTFPLNVDVPKTSSGISDDERIQEVVKSVSPAAEIHEPNVMVVNTAPQHELTEGIIASSVGSTNCEIPNIGLGLLPPTEAPAVTQALVVSSVLPSIGNSLEEVIGTIKEPETFVLDNVKKEDLSTPIAAPSVEVTPIANTHTIVTSTAPISDNIPNGGSIDDEKKQTLIQQELIGSSAAGPKPASVDESEYISIPTTESPTTDISISAGDASIIASLPQAELDSAFGVKPIDTTPQFQIPGLRPSVPARPRPEYIDFISQGADLEPTTFQSPASIPVIVSSPPVRSSYSQEAIVRKQQEMLERYFSDFAREESIME